MLKFMRQHATSWFIKIALGLIIIVFIFWGVGGFRGSEEAVVARVGKTIIDIKTYRDAYQKMVEYYRKQYKDQWNEKLLKLFDVKHRVLNQLINQVLIAQEAKRLHITVSDKEVAESIESMPAFRRNGHFSRRLYLDLLRYNRIEPSDFEQSKKRELLYEKVKGLVAQPASFVTSAELGDLLSLQYEKRRLAYVKILSRDFVGKVKVSEADLKKYYDAHKEMYRQPERVKVSYLLFEPGDYTGRVNVSEGEINKYYETYREKYRVPERVHARHIQPARTKSLKEVKGEIEKKLKLKKARDIALKEADKAYTELYTHPNLAEYAKKHGLKIHETAPFSKDSRAAEGVIPEDSFVSAAFSLKKGEISTILDLKRGYCLMQLVDRQASRIKTLKEVKGRVKDAVIAEKSMEFSHKKADALIEALRKGGNLQRLALKEGLKVNKTGLFGMMNPTDPDLGGSLSGAINEIALLTKVNPVVSHPLLLGRSGYAVCVLDEVVPPEPEEVRKEENKLRVQLRRVKGEKALQSWLDALKKKTKIEIRQKVLDSFS